MKSMRVVVIGGPSGSAANNKLSLAELSRYEQRCQFSLMKKARKLLFRVARKKQSSEAYHRLLNLLFEKAMPNGELPSLLNFEEEFNGFSKDESAEVSDDSEFNNNSFSDLSFDVLKDHYPQCLVELTEVEWHETQTVTSDGLEPDESIETKSIAKVDITFPKRTEKDRETMWHSVGDADHDSAESDDSDVGMDP